MVPFGLSLTKSWQLLSERAVGTFDIFRIKGGSVHAISCSSQVLRVIAGQAWITFDHQDQFLKAGDEVRLPAGGHTAVISNIGRGTLLYVIIPS